MSKTNKLNQYAVLWLHSQNTQIADISNETGLSTKQIENIIKKHNTQISSTGDTPTNQHGPVKSLAKQLMITESVGKRQKVSIMTKEASQIADEAKKKQSPVNNNKPYIFRPSTDN